MPNEFDNIVPNTQVPGKSTIGESGNMWGEIYATSGSFEQIEVNNFVLNGQNVSGVISYDAAQFIGQLDGSSNIYNVVHNLGTKVVSVSIYDNNDNKVIPNNISLIDIFSFQLEFVEPQAGIVLVQRGKE